MQCAAIWCWFSLNFTWLGEYCQSKTTPRLILECHLFICSQLLLHILFSRCWSISPSVQSWNCLWEVGGCCQVLFSLWHCVSVHGPLLVSFLFFITKVRKCTFYLVYTLRDCQLMCQVMSTSIENKICDSILHFSFISFFTSYWLLILIINHLVKIKMLI